MDDTGDHDVGARSPIARVSTGERGWRFSTIGASFSAIGLFALAATAEHATPEVLVGIIALVGTGFAFALGPLDALMMDRTSPKTAAPPPRSVT
jgi:hypothetical protein